MFFHKRINLCLLLATSVLCCKSRNHESSEQDKPHIVYAKRSAIGLKLQAMDDLSIDNIGRLKSKSGHYSRCIAENLISAGDIKANTLFNIKDVYYVSGRNHTIVYPFVQESGNSFSKYNHPRKNTLISFKLNHQNDESQEIILNCFISFPRPDPVDEITPNIQIRLADDSDFNRKLFLEMSQDLLRLFDPAKALKK